MRELCDALFLGSLVMLKALFFLPGFTVLGPLWRWEYIGALAVTLAVLAYTYSYVVSRCFWGMVLQCVVRIADLIVMGLTMKLLDE